MRLNFYLVVLLVILVNQSVKGNVYIGKDIVIEVLVVESKFVKDSAITWIPESDDLFYSEWKKPSQLLSANKLKYKIHSTKPAFIDLRKLLNTGVSLTLFEPGDSIVIDLTTTHPILYGKGREKLQLLLDLKKMEQSILFINNPKHEKAVTINDYLLWSTFLDRKFKGAAPIFEKYRSKMSKKMFDHVKALWISGLEFKRIKEYGRLSEDNLEAKKEVFFQTMFSEQANWLRRYQGKTDYVYTYEFVRQFVWIKHNFDFEGPVLNSVKRKLEYAKLGKQIYRGESLHQFLSYLITQHGIEDHNYENGLPEIEKLVQDFYAMPRFDQYKNYVKRFDHSMRAWRIQKGDYASELDLPDQDGNKTGKNQFHGKVVVLSFLDSGKKSIKLISALQKIQQSFDKNNNVVFVNVFVTMDHVSFQKQLKDPRFVLTDAVNLYTNGKNIKHRLLEYYLIEAAPELQLEAFPQTFLLDHRWRFLHNGRYSVERAGTDNNRYHETPTDLGVPNLIKDNGALLINRIKQQLALMKDGPYVFYKQDSLIAFSISNNNVNIKSFEVHDQTDLLAQTDEYHKSFAVRLKKNLERKASETILRPKELFVLSDIEGEFEAFRKLLQSNKVIDKDFNWIFGKGHLVFAGDMFDRGVQVTECLWLVYMLEEQAKKAGGYVHFVLGNHEIMNLQGDHRYVDSKYRENASLMGKTLVQLYNEDSELGRWLRTKNIIEKIGDLLFAHGGISPEVNKMGLTLMEINALSRPYYAVSDSANRSSDERIKTLFNSYESPFWYRHYYEEDHFSKSQNKLVRKADLTQINETLKKFGVKHIITGHTIVADTISIHYGGKVINTDTRHKKGKSEALLIEGKDFYRVNAEGRKVLLFREEKN